MIIKSNKYKYLKKGKKYLIIHNIMNNHPEIIFKIGEKLDKEVCADFINSKIGDYDFGKERIISDHSKLIVIRSVKNKKESKKIISNYINDYYSSNEKEINKSLLEIKKIWKKKENIFFSLLKKIFGDLSFNKSKKIKCYLSIFKCGVITDELDGFQIWYGTVADKNEVVRHIVHEILHFYYYKYLKKKRFKKIIKNWDLAEIFNVIILNLPDFKKITGKKEIGYEIHEKYLPDFKKIWKKSKNLNEYLELSEKY